MIVPILNNADVLVTDQFLSNTTEISQESFEIEHIGTGDQLDLDVAMAVFTSKVAMLSGDDVASLDSEFAATLHQSLRISKYIAGHSEFWHYLTLRYGIEYTRERWQKSSSNDERSTLNKGRVLGKWERNALGRLWWWAELTSISNDYSWTHRGAANQTFMMNILDINIGAEKRLVTKLIDLSFPEGAQLTENQIGKFLFPRLNADLAVINIDVMSDEELQLYLSQLVDEAFRFRIVPLTAMAAE
jgi:hypothetical protein